MIRAVALLCAMLLCGCALRPPSPQAFEFAVLGDTPYSDAEERHFLAMMKRIDAEPLAFAVHVGDFKSGSGSPCSDALFERRKAQFDASAHPFIYTPGDNEWTDCRRKSSGAMSPIERLARLRQVFFAEPWSLGATRIATEMQVGCVERGANACTCPALPENRFWTRAGVRFVTLNIPGSDNNVGYDAANDEEARCRNEANRRWLERAVSECEREQAPALAILIQANPWLSEKPVYKDFIAQVEAAARRLRPRPVLFVHGDTHTFRIDTPFVDAAGEPIPNLTRLETYGSPAVGWVRVSVDPRDPQVFRMRGFLEAIVLPH